MVAQQIPLHSMRDLIMARNALRKNLNAQGITQPNLQARSAAVITALAELILAVGATGILSLDVVGEDELSGIELACELSWLPGQLKSLTSVRKRQLNDVQRRLKRVTDDVQCDTEDAEHPNLIVRIWN